MVEILVIGSEELVDGFRLAGIKGIVEKDVNKAIEITQREKADIYIIEGDYTELNNKEAIKGKHILFLQGYQDPIQLARALLGINI